MGEVRILESMNEKDQVWDHSIHQMKMYEHKKPKHQALVPTFNRSKAAAPRAVLWGTIPRTTR